VRGVEHLFNVGQLEENHEANREHGIVGGADILHVVIHLIGHEPELLKDEAVGHFFDAEMPALGRVPGKGVQPFAGLRNELGRAVDHAAGDRAGAVLLAVDDDGLLGGKLQSVLPCDFLMRARIEPDVGRAGDVFLLAVAIADDEEFAGVRDEVTHRQKDVAAAPDALGPDDDGHGPVGPAHENALPFFDDVKEHGGTSERTGGIFAVTDRRPSGGGSDLFLQIDTCHAAHRPRNVFFRCLETEVRRLQRSIREFLQHGIDGFRLVAIMMCDRSADVFARKGDEANLLVDDESELIREQSVLGVRRGDDQCFTVERHGQNRVLAGHQCGHELEHRGRDAEKRLRHDCRRHGGAGSFVQRAAFLQIPIFHDDPLREDVRDETVRLIAR
jgi:hypothetical protein